MDSVGEGEGGKIWENGIETCVISCMKRKIYIYITLPTKVRLVKVIVFPVVMYGCESWTIKKAER